MCIIIIKYQVIHLNVMTSAGPLDITDVHDTWLHVKLYHQVNTLLIH